MRRLCFALLGIAALEAGVWAQDTLPPIYGPVKDPVPLPAPLKKDPFASDDPKQAPKKGGFQIDTTGGFGGDPNGKGNAEKVLGHWARGLMFTGGWTLTARANEVDGSSQAREWFNFQNNNNFYNTGNLGPFQQNLNLSLTGKLFNTLDVNGTLTNNRINASLAQLMKVRYDDKKGTIVDLGDVPANLTGNELVPFSRNVQGVRYERSLGAGRKVTTLASVTRALTRRNSFQGQGITGPYYLGGSMIVPGTEKIFVNGQEMVPGIDYELDTQLGILRFLKSRIINRSDTVEYTYELLNYNTSSGVLTGMRWDLPLQKGNQLGVTMLRQSAAGGGGANKQVNQYFPVDANLSTRYTLASPISPGTGVEVRYQERLLVEGVAADYLINRDLNYIQLRRPLPPDTALTGLASLKITYTPVLQQGIGGNREVIGVDSQFLVPGNGRVKVQVGRSNAQTRAATGTGVDVTARFASPEKQKNGRWTASTTFRDIGSTFSSIDSTAGAFLRAERGMRGNFTYAPGDLWDVGLSLNTTRFPNVSYTTAASAATPTGFTDNQGINVALNLNLPSRKGKSLPKIRLVHSQTNQRTTTTTSSSSSADPRSSFISDSINLDWTLGTLRLGTTLDRTVSKGRTVFAVGYTGGVGSGQTSTGGGFLGGVRDGSTSAGLTNGSSNSLRFNAGWTPSERLSLTGNVGVSRNITSGSGSNATDSQFGALYWIVPDKLQAEVTIGQSRNGQSLAGFYSSGGVVSGGSNDTIGLSTGQQTRTRDLRLGYTPNQLLRIDLRRSENLALIPNYDNQNSVNNDLTVSYSPTALLNLTATVGNQQGNYVGGQGDFDNTNYTVAATLTPPKGVQIRASAARMNFGSTSFYTGGTGGLGTGFGSGGLGSGFGNALVQGGRNDILGLRFDYQVKALVPFLELQDMNATAPASQNSGGVTGSQYHSSTNYRRLEARLGVEWRFTSVLGATLDFRYARMRDRDDSRYSYNARTFNFDISARF